MSIPGKDESKSWPARQVFPCVDDGMVYLHPDDAIVEDPFSVNGFLDNLDEYIFNEEDQVNLPLSRGQ